VKLIGLHGVCNLQKVLSIIIDKYKWYPLPGSPKRIEWKLLGAVTTINTTEVHSNLAEQYWHKWRIIAIIFLGTLIEILINLPEKKGRKLIAITLERSHAKVNVSAYKGLWGLVGLECNG